ncbi:uncharacterized protein LOC101861082 [Aplysia californica]|uniref:Uncharacterized protein LOC101861082 n=1 Tax=Aplysia californica TaxID=6500 RepID=A0ABM1ABK4_APLCA|nr:uncharacterized protein LOC101861082 [Aplysia californica]
MTANGVASTWPLLLLLLLSLSLLLFPFFYVVVGEFTETSGDAANCTCSLSMSRELVKTDKRLRLEFDRKLRHVEDRLLKRLGKASLNQIGEQGVIRDNGASTDSQRQHQASVERKSKVQMPRVQHNRNRQGRVRLKPRRSKRDTIHALSRRAAHVENAKTVSDALIKLQEYLNLLDQEERRQRGEKADSQLESKPCQRSIASRKSPSREKTKLLRKCLTRTRGGSLSSSNDVTYQAPEKETRVSNASDRSIAGNNKERQKPFSDRDPNTTGSNNDIADTTLSVDLRSTSEPTSRRSLLSDKSKPHASSTCGEKFQAGCQVPRSKKFSKEADIATPSIGETDELAKSSRQSRRLGVFSTIPSPANIEFSQQSNKPMTLGHGSSGMYPESQGQIQKVFASDGGRISHVFNFYNVKEAKVDYRRGDNVMKDGRIHNILGKTVDVLESIFKSKVNPEPKDRLSEAERPNLADETIKLERPLGSTTSIRGYIFADHQSPPTTNGKLYKLRTEKGEGSFTGSQIRSSETPVTLDSYESSTVGFVRMSTDFSGLSSLDPSQKSSAGYRTPSRLNADNKYQQASTYSFRTEEDHVDVLVPPLTTTVPLKEIDSSTETLRHQITTFGFNTKGLDQDVSDSTRGVDEIVPTKMVYSPLNQNVDGAGKKPKYVEKESAKPRYLLSEFGAHGTLADDGADWDYDTHLDYDFPDQGENFGQEVLHKLDTIIDILNGSVQKRMLPFATQLHAGNSFNHSQPTQMNSEDKNQGNAFPSLKMSLGTRKASSLSETERVSTARHILPGYNAQNKEHPRPTDQPRADLKHVSRDPKDVFEEKYSEKQSVPSLRRFLVTDDIETNRKTLLAENELSRGDAGLPYINISPNEESVPDPAMNWYFSGEEDDTKNAQSTNTSGLLNRYDMLQKTSHMLDVLSKRLSQCSADMLNVDTNVNATQKNMGMHSSCTDVFHVMKEMGDKLSNTISNKSSGFSFDTSLGKDKEKDNSPHEKGSEADTPQIDTGRAIKQIEKKIDLLNQEVSQVVADVLEVKEKFNSTTQKDAIKKSDIKEILKDLGILAGQSIQSYADSSEGKKWQNWESEEVNVEQKGTDLSNKAILTDILNRLDRLEENDDPLSTTKARVKSFSMSTVNKTMEQTQAKLSNLQWSMRELNQRLSTAIFTVDRLASRAGIGTVTAQLAVSDHRPETAPSLGWDDRNFDRDRSSHFFK